jgi:hypothetical protein
MLPNTQHLGHLLLGTSDPLEWLDSRAEVWQIAEGGTWGDGATKAAMKQPATCVPTTTTTSSSRSICAPADTTSSRSSSSSSRGAWGAPVACAATPVPSAAAGTSWRTSCHTLLVGSPKRAMGVGALQPLLGALQQPQALYLFGAGVGMWGLPACIPLLQPLRALHLCGVSSMTHRGMEAVACLTNLRHLCVTGTNCTPDWHIPRAFSSMVHLTSLDLTNTPIKGWGLVHACGAPALQQLSLTDCSSCSYLPDAISRLTGLEALTLHRCAVAELPEGVTALGRLRNLVWTPCTTQCPSLDVVWSLTSLRSLTLNVVGDPAVIGTITSEFSWWRWWYLCGGWLASPPAGISRLTGLVHSQLDAWWLDWENPLYTAASLCRGVLVGP